MKKIFGLLIIISLFSGCRKDYKNTDFLCNNLTTIEGWAKIDFKTDYTFQLPDGYEGPGMIGFEGYTFLKNSADNKIKLSYSFCGPLWCNDFGDTLSVPYPERIYVMGNFENMIPLDKIEYFCQDSEVFGVLYFSDDDISKGLLYWKDNDHLKAALGLEFYQTELGTVKKIIQTIKRK